MRHFIALHLWEVNRYGYRNRNNGNSKKNAIDLIVTMVVSELSDDLGLSASDLLPQFITSATGKLLYDESTKMWWSGPSDIAQMYKEEKKKNS